MKDARSVVTVDSRQRTADYGDELRESYTYPDSSRQESYRMDVWMSLINVTHVIAHSKIEHATLGTEIL